MNPAPLDPNDLAARERREPSIEEFEVACLGGGRPRIEDFLTREPEAARGALFRELLVVELAYRRQRGEVPNAAEYAARFRQHEPVSAELFAQTSAHATPKSDSRRSSDARRREARFPPGTLLAGRYEIVSTPESGGMGEVYQAEDLELGEQVALKFLRGDRADDQTWIERFRQEVTLARKVTHKNVCRVHDLGAHNGSRFLVMEYVAGGNLLAQSRMRPSGRFAPAEVIAYARQLCDGLAAVHESGLLHRDLKPANVLLSGDGPVKLADFGLAAAAVGLSADEVGAGTVLYMAPEQLSGKEVTARSDLFALGLILYELTTGQRPFPGSTRAELVRQQADTIPPRPSDLVDRLDPVLEKAILWCLERDPKKRPASAREVSEALPLPTPKEVERWVESKPLRPKVALALLGAALLGLLIHAAIADWTMAYRQLPEAKSRDYLHERAKEIVGSLGNKNKQKAENNGFEWDLDLVRYASNRSSTAWRPGHDERSPLVYFWYRCGPDHHTPANRVTPTDPPLATSGMECVLLDLDGRLLEYHAVPTRTARPTEGRTRDEWREHWERELFQASKLDRANFVRVPPKRRPLVFADDVWALQEVGGTGKRVVMAVCDGNPVYFRVGEPFSDGKDRPDRAEGENVEAQAQRRLAGGLVSIAILLLAVAAAGPVAYRNWRLGRADISGGLRVVAIYAVSAFVGWVLITSHTRSLHVERVLLMNSFGIMSFWGLILLVCYLAVEPYMRRRWPERLSTWKRVLNGRLRDPLVGRDVLVGLIVGACAAFPLKLIAAALGTYYLLSPVYEPLTPNVPPGIILVLVGVALLRAAGTFVLLLLFGLLFRRESLALVIVIAVTAVSAAQPVATLHQKSVLVWIGSVTVVGLFALTAVRYGWVATLIASFTTSMLNIMPLTFTPHAWYAGTTLTAALVLVALAVYGFFVSLGDQRLFPDDQ